MDTITAAPIADSAPIAPLIGPELVSEPETLSLPKGKPSADQWAVLGGLRFFLAMVVMSRHATIVGKPFCPFIEQFGGYAAVICFMVISGYSMAHSLTQDSNAARFYVRRFWRIYPVYVTSLALAVAANVLDGFPIHVNDCINMFGELTFLQNIQTELVRLFWPSWSLGIEVWLYAMAPLFIALRHRAYIAIIAISLVVSLAHYFLKLSEPAYVNGFWGIGLMTAPWLSGFAYYRMRSTCKTAPIVLLAGAAMLAFRDFDATVGRHSMMLYIICCVVLILGHKIVFSASIGNFLRFIGDLSYPLYISHGIMLSQFVHAPGMAVPSAVAVAVVILLAIDYPLRKFSRRKFKSVYKLSEVGIGFRRKCSHFA
ncbi:MAG: acyltransferase [Capsulimonadaceae bacterium]|nr:acyltransferase [Capsulimonadaceae bacterium]